MAGSQLGTYSGDCSMHWCGEPGNFLLVQDETDPFRFTRPDGQIVTIDRPIITDGATIPRFVRWFKWLDPFGTFVRAAWVHDWRWILRYTGENQIGFLASNVELYHGCRACGLNKVQAGIVLAGTTLFGWPWWIWGERRRLQARMILERSRTLHSAIKRRQCFQAQQN